MRDKDVSERKAGREKDVTERDAMREREAGREKVRERDAMRGKDVAREKDVGKLKEIMERDVVREGYGCEGCRDREKVKVGDCKKTKRDYKKKYNQIEN